MTVEGGPPARLLGPVAADEVGQLPRLVHHALGQHLDRLFHVGEVLVEGGRRGLGLACDVGDLDRAPGRRGQQLDRGVQQALAGLASPLPGHPSVGGRDLLGVGLEVDDGGVSPGASSCHGGPAYRPRPRRPRWRRGYAVGDGADADPPARPRQAGPAAARDRRRHGLGLEGGYEAVQMRDVAARADVAMGTVYRYFTSKDHLLAATLVYWVELLDTRIGQHPPRGDHPADRVLDVLDRALSAMGRQPSWWPPSSPRCRHPTRRQSAASSRSPSSWRGSSRPPWANARPGMSDRGRMIGHVWYSALVGWVNGWSTMAGLRRAGRVGRLLLPDLRGPHPYTGRPPPPAAS